MAKKYLQLGSVLKRLLFERDLRPVELSREVNLPPTTIHRLITGKSTRPYKSSLKPIADYFSISVEQLLGESPLDSEKNTTPYDSIHYIPFIPWDALSNNNFSPSKKIPFSGILGSPGFATSVTDSSMEPQFSKNNLLIFDPEKKLYDRAFVLAELENNIFIFRQLLIDGKNQFLKPLNPDLNICKMHLLRKKDRIIGVLIEARHIYVGSGAL